MSPILLLCGDDPQAADREIAALIRPIPEELRDFAVARLDADSSEAAAIRSVVEASVFGAERRVVVLRRAQRFRDKAQLAECVARAPEDCALVLCFDEPRPSLGPIAKALEKQKRAKTIVFWPPRPDEMRRRAAEFFARHRLSPEPEALDLLGERLATDFSVADRELEKIRDWCGEGSEERIGVAQVELLLGLDPQSDLFTVVGALLDGPRAEAVRIFASWLRRSGDLHGLSAILIAETFRLCHFAEKIAAGVSEDEAFRQVGAHFPKMKDALRSRHRRRTLAGQRRLLALALELDDELKGSYLVDENIDRGRVHLPGRKKALQLLLEAAA